MNKSYATDNKITQYCLDNTTKQHPLQKELHEKTQASNEIRGTMEGAPEVMIFNQAMLKALNAKRVLDIGTFTGQSALSAALALPDDGQVITMDVDDSAYVKFGLPIIEKAGLSQRIVSKVQPALQTLDELITAGESGKFDFSFIDADKLNYFEYYNKSMTLLRSGGIIVIDNSIWSGQVIEPESKMSPNTKAIVECSKKVTEDPRSINVLSTLGDGIMICTKL